MGFAVALVGLLVALEKWRPWRADLGADVDGDFGPEGSTAAATPHLKAAEGAP